MNKKTHTTHNKIGHKKEGDREREKNFKAFTYVEA